jgi:hypothetical protein
MNGSFLMKIGSKLNEIKLIKFKTIPCNQIQIPPSPSSKRDFSSGVYDFAASYLHS